MEITLYHLTFILVIIGVLTLLYMLYKHTRKSLSYNYSIIDSKSLTDNTLKEEIKVLFNEKKVSNLFIAKIKIFNSGNVSILEKDFYTNLIIEFGENAKILKCQVIDKVDKYLNIDYEINDNKLEIKPLLLNKGGWFSKGDWFILKIIVSGSIVNKPRLFSRIADLKRITYSTEYYTLMKWMFIIGFGFIIATMIYTFWAMLSGFALEDNATAVRNTIILSMIGFFILIVPITWIDYNYRFSRKK